LIRKGLETARRAKAYKQAQERGVDMKEIDKLLEFHTPKKSNYTSWGQRVRAGLLGKRFVGADSTDEELFV